jgi:cathepsin B
MKTFTAGALVAAASATDLSLTWSDCGDASTKTKISAFKPSSLTLGQKTTMTGTGALSEDVPGATFDLEMTGAIGKLVSCQGDASAAKTCSLPLGTGSLTFDAMTFPLKAGSTDVNVDISLSSAVPASLQTTTTRCTAAASNGDKLFCIEIKSAPAQAVHPERAAQIEEIQKTSGVMWKAAAHPRFASQAPGAFKDMNGILGDHKQSIADGLASGELVAHEADANAAVPSSFDSEQNWPQCAKIIGDIRDQSNCGCCWAFGGAEAASDRMCIASNASLMLPLSAQDVCFNSNFNGCGGGQISTPWSYIKSTGAVTGGLYQGSGPFGSGLCSSFSLPHCHHHGPQGEDPYPAEGAPGCPSQSSPRGPSSCDSDAKAPHNNFASDKYTFSGQTISASGEANIQSAIMAGGPMETAFTVYSDFENYAGGIYHHVSGGMAGGHAVKFVGWGEENGQKYWKVANSWNPYWGEKGYFRIRRGNNEGGIEDGAVASSPSATWSKKSAGAVVV